MREKRDQKKRKDGRGGRREEREQRKDQELKLDDERSEDMMIDVDKERLKEEK